MAITDIIPRDQGMDPAHGSDAVFGATPNPEAVTFFQQHGPVITLTDDMIARTVLVPGGEAADRALNLVIPELVNPLLNPAFAADPLSLPTPDRVVPDRVHFRQGPISMQLEVPSGPFVPENPPGSGRGFVEVWPFEDTGAGILTWPSKAIRSKQGEVHHVELSSRFKEHTIHMHAIEPTCVNDGPAHVSMGVGGGLYRYQAWCSEAGTYLYHCHVNTVLHFEMGMYGFLIVDPPVSGAPFADGGPGVIRRANQLVNYDVEALWAVDEIDARWHNDVLPRLGHSAGILDPFYNTDGHGNPTGNENPRLNDFDPKIFLISGIPSPWTMPNVKAPGHPGAAIRATKGQKILIRLLHAGYTQQFYTFGLPMEVIGIDCRFLGYGPYMQYSEPFMIPANKTFSLSTARRWDLLIDTANIAAGTYPVHIDFMHYVRHDQKMGELDTQIIIQ